MLVQKLLNINKYKCGTNLADFFPETVEMFNIYSCYYDLFSGKVIVHSQALYSA